MTLLERLAAIPDIIPEGSCEALSRYFVKDQTDNPEMRFVLLCESPHIHETYHGVPLAGKSGSSVTKFLAIEALGITDTFCYHPTGPYHPLGRILKECRENEDNNYDNRFLKLGVMNVCQLPLQKSVYEEDIQTNCATLFSCLKTIRNGPSVEICNRKCETTKMVENAIFGDFLERWNGIMCRFGEDETRKLLVPCGEFAKAFCDKGGIQDCLPSQIEFETETIPHPSYNQWSDSTQIRQLATRIQGMLNDDQPLQQP